MIECIIKAPCIVRCVFWRKEWEWLENETEIVLIERNWPIYEDVIECKSFQTWNITTLKFAETHGYDKDKHVIVRFTYLNQDEWWYAVVPKENVVFLRVFRL